MLRVDTVQKVLARLARGAGVKVLTRELGVDRKTVKRRRRRVQWRPRGVDPILSEWPSVGQSLAGTRWCAIACGRGTCSY